jgi:HAD superfamily hydrolase (TIGR01549 family)
MVQSMQRALEGLGVTAIWEEIYQSMKHSVPETIRRYSLQHSLREDELFNHYVDIRHQEMRAEQDLYPGAKELLEDICAEGGHNYIFTHRGESAHSILNNLNMEGLFDEVVTALEGFPRKPNPAGLLYLMQKHDLRPEETVVIGDRMLDLETGENAGLKGILFDPEHYYDGCKVSVRADSMEAIMNILEVKEMTFFDLAAERYSVRSFSNVPVEADKLKQVLECGRLAPTAKNLQPQKIYVLESPEALAKIRQLTPCTFGAPVVLLVCGDTDQAWTNAETGHSTVEMDVSIVTTHMMMCAEDIGLSSTWVCRFDAAQVKEAFALPENIRPYCLLPLGYAAETAVPSPNHLLRKPLSETIQVL